LSRPLALLTDFGLHDAYVGVMKAVLVSRVPALTLIDLCHAVPPQDIRHAAFLLATSVTYLPVDCVVLVVVDPGVGTSRRAVAVEAGGRTFVAPDNGVLAWALRTLARAGSLSLRMVDERLQTGPDWRAVELTERRFWLPELSSTFHGRDVFAPVAGELSLGRSLDELGQPIDTLVDLPWLDPFVADDGAVEATVVAVDTYGNLFTSLRLEHLPNEPVFEIAGHVVRGLAPHFQVARSLVALIGSTGLIEIAAPNGSAAALLGLGPGAPIRVRSA
jgi:S-adenosyl-L-methionine hydrolase (adenosine-forming)